MWYVPAKNWQNIQRSTKCLRHSRWHSNCRVWYWWQRSWQIQKQIMQYYFRCIKTPFFGKVISRKGVQLDPKKSWACYLKCSHNRKKLQSFMVIMNYLGKFSLSSTEVCELLRKLDIIKMWMDLEQDISKPLWQSQKHHQKECNHGILQWQGPAILRNRCIGCWLGASLQQARDGMQFP